VSLACRSSLVALLCSCLAMTPRYWTESSPPPPPGGDLTLEALGKLVLAFPSLKSHCSHL